MKTLASRLFYGEISLSQPLRGSLCLPAIPGAVLASFIAASTARAQTPQLEQLPPQLETGIPTLGDLDTPGGDDELSAFSFSFTLPTASQIPADLEQETFYMESLEIEGVTAFSKEELAPCYEGLAGRDVTVGEFYKVAQDIQKHYQNAGYVLSFAFVPEQASGDGNFRITVVEGFLEKTEIRGVVGYEAERISNTLAPLVISRPLKIDDLESRMLRLNDLAGLKGKAIIRPGSETGASILILDVSRKDLEFTASATNRNPDIVGPWYSTGEIRSNNLFGLGENISLGASITPEPSEMVSLSAKATVPLTYSGWVVTGRVHGSRTKVGGDLKDFDLQSESFSAGLTTEFPMFRSRDFSWIPGAGIKHSRSRTTLLGEKFSNPRSTTFIFRNLVNYREGLLDGSGHVQLMMEQGLPILGASLTGSDDFSRTGNVKADYLKASLSLGYYVSLPDQFSLEVAVKGQYAFDRLPGSALFSVGGSGFGRAYDSGALSADHGVAGSLTLNYTLPIYEWEIDNLKPFGRVDAAKVWDRGSAGGTYQQFVTAAGGVVFSFTPGISATMEYARSIHQDSYVLKSGTNERVNFDLKFDY